METYELIPQTDTRKSFYGKAKIKIYDEWVYLQSYNTDVCRVSNIAGINKAEVFGTYSCTTLRHIKEFLLQHGFKADNKQQILKDYLI